MADVLSPISAENAPKARKTRGGPAAASCEGCYFRQNLLCALECDEPCANFRPYTPEGLRPPQQLRFQFRTDTRHTSSWAFPSADEQARIHAA